MGMDAYAVDYHDACAAFNNAPESNLAKLDHALTRVESVHIDAAEAEELVGRVIPMLENADLGRAIAACRLIVRLQLRKPESLRLGSFDAAEKAAAAFRKFCELATGANTAVLEDLRALVALWEQLVVTGRVEESTNYLLVASALNWTFVNAPQPVLCRAFTRFIAVSFARLDSASQDRVLHDVLSSWFKSGSSVAAIVVDLVLSLVAVAGQVPISVWEEAVGLRSRTQLDILITSHSQQAVATATTVSRRIIHWAWPHKHDVQPFLAECARRVPSPQWPAAELFVSAFVASLLDLAHQIRAQKYAVFLFASLRELHICLPKEQIPNTNVSNANVLVEVVKAIRACVDRDQALYLATRQCSLPNQPYLELYKALNASPSDEQPENWPSFLSQYPLAGYRSQIIQFLEELALREDLRDAHQVELFKLADQWDLFKTEWLTRLKHASPLVCESLVPLVQKEYTKTNNVEAVRQLCTRIEAPGAAAFKARTLAMLLAFEPSQEILAFAWRAALICASDYDRSAASAGVTACDSLFQHYTALNPDVGNAVHSALIAALNGSALSARGLKQYLISKQSKEMRQRVQKFVGRLITENELDLAATFLKVDGIYMPVSQIGNIFETEGIFPLRILDYALRARPRAILASSLTSKMFSSFITKLKSRSETEICHVGSILGQLVSLGGPHIESQRSQLLRRVINQSFNLAKQLFQPEIQDTKVEIFKQALLICGCQRYWPASIDEARPLCHTFIEMAPIVPDHCKLTIVRVVFGLASRHAMLFNDRKVDMFFSELVAGSKEAACFNNELLKYMWNEPIRESKDKASHMTVFGSANEEDSAASIMLQRHISRLVDLALREEDVMALRVVISGLDENLVVADECIPTIVALCFSQKPDVSQTALRAFVMLCMANPPHLGLKFVEGIRLTQGEGKSGSLPFMWQVYKDYQRQKNVKPMIAQLCKVVLCHESELAKLDLVVHGLCAVKLDKKDAKYLVQCIEDGLHQYESERHGHDSGVKMVLVHLFTLWLRRRYGLSEYSKASKLAMLSEDEELEPIRCLEISESLKEIDVTRILNELWNIPDYYGTKRMNELLYSKRQRPN